MTQKEAKYGCLSKTLYEFLSLHHHEKRKEKYGNRTAKYYGRVVKSVNESFKDHIKALFELPDEYRKKIDFVSNYDNMIYSAIKEQWITEPPNKLLKETMSHLDGVQGLFAYRYKQLAKEDFQRVLLWLEILRKDIQTKQKKA